jgi:uncharacterized protein YecT (DUF1311 family)
MNGLSKCLSAIGFFAFAHTAQAAQEPEFSKAYKACMDTSGGVTSAMLECSDAETAFQDVRLNKAFQALMKVTPAKRQK